MAFSLRIGLSGHPDPNSIGCAHENSNNPHLTDSTIDRQEASMFSGLKWD